MSDAVLSETVLEISGLEFQWSKQSPVMHVDQLEVLAGERVFLKGASGSGKSTLLSLIGGVTTATTGRLAVLQKDLQSMSAKQRDRFRADHLGLIFQQFNLIPYLTALENVLLTGRFSKQRKISQKDAFTLLDELGIDSQLAEKQVFHLSIGQQQRVAAARVLAGKPQLIIADEPTSALDEETRDGYLDLLFHQCQSHGATLVFVSHDRTLASLFDREVNISDVVRWSNTSMNNEQGGAL
ncbi:methionine ABC transporter ATP-binding protein [Litoribrevibacter albus]|uniref:Methionine ABC transporter ATP-binding protein n=2 Tax=Litoribrevibacter albus TaxID=1473156 RepID=A0AA37W913_9GAMM|nr:methionine ABC transporter ATP-binding protein [Litoribrevibacter albus]